MLAPDSRIMGSLLLHHSDRCKDALAISKAKKSRFEEQPVEMEGKMTQGIHRSRVMNGGEKTQAVMRNPTWELCSLDIFTGLVGEENITLPETNSKFAPEKIAS